MSRTGMCLPRHFFSANIRLESKFVPNSLRRPLSHSSFFVKTPQYSSRKWLWTFPKSFTRPKSGFSIRNILWRNPSVIRSGASAENRFLSSSLLPRISFTSFSARLKNFKFRSFATHRDVRYGNFNFEPRWKFLIKPTIFTIAFIASSGFIFSFLFNLPGFQKFRKDPRYLVYAILAANAAIFIAWRIPTAWRTLYKYFVLEESRDFHLASMFGSAFSHREFWHVLINSYFIYDWGCKLALALGADTFACLYFDSVLLSSWFSLAVPIMLKRASYGSIGASGAAFGIMAFYSWMMPETRISVFFIPSPLDLWNTFLLITVGNFAGVAFRWGAIDYAGHIGGTIMGLFYAYTLQRYVDRARQQKRR